MGAVAVAGFMATKSSKKMISYAPVREEIALPMPLANTPFDAEPYYRSEGVMNTSDPVKKRLLDTYTGNLGPGEGVSKRTSVAGSFGAEVNIQPGLLTEANRKDRYTQDISGKQNNVLPFAQVRVGPGLGVGPDVVATGGFQQFDRVMPKNVGEYNKTQLASRTNAGRGSAVPSGPQAVGALDPHLDKKIIDSGRAMLPNTGPNAAITPHPNVIFHGCTTRGTSPDTRVNPGGGISQAGGMGEFESRREPTIGTPLINGNSEGAGTYTYGQRTMIEGFREQTSVVANPVGGMYGPTSREDGIRPTLREGTSTFFAGVPGMSNGARTAGPGNTGTAFATNRGDMSEYMGASGTTNSGYSRGEAPETMNSRETTSVSLFGPSFGGTTSYAPMSRGGMAPPTNNRIGTEGGRAAGPTPVNVVLTPGAYKTTTDFKSDDYHARAVASGRQHTNTQTASLGSYDFSSNRTDQTNVNTARFLQNVESAHKQLGSNPFAININGA